MPTEQSLRFVQDQIFPLSTRTIKMFSEFHEYTLNVRLVFGFLAFRCSFK